MLRVFVYLSFVALVWSIATASSGKSTHEKVDSVTTYYYHFRCFDACFRLYSDLKNQLPDRYECCKPCYRAIFSPNVVLLD